MMVKSSKILLSQLTVSDAPMEKQFYNFTQTTSHKKI
jgi:hypothetical protein